MKAFQVIFFSCFLWWNLCNSQPRVLVKGIENALAIKSEIEAYAELLNIWEKVHLTVKYTRKIPENIKGFTLLIDSAWQGSYSHIAIWMDARLEGTQHHLVLAHEMIHVKQMVKGELLAFKDRPVIWKGKKYYEKLYNHLNPWELEAYREDNDLRKALYEMSAADLLKKTK